MSEIEETRSRHGRICPYCKYEYQPEGEDYSEDSRVEECGGCGKSYHAEDNFSVTFVAVPDCELNNEAHDWQDQDLRDGRKHPFCEKCGKCKPLERTHHPRPSLADEGEKV